MKTELSTLIEDVNTIHSNMRYDVSDAPRKYFKKYKYRVCFKVERYFPETDKDKALAKKLFDWHTSPSGILRNIANAFNEKYGKGTVKTRNDWHVFSVYLLNEEHFAKFMKKANVIAKKFEDQPYYVREVNEFRGPDDLHESKVICKKLPYNGKYRLKAYIKLKDIPKGDGPRIADYLENTEGIRAEKYTISNIRNGRIWSYSPRVINFKDRKTLFAFSLMAGDCIHKVDEYVTENELKSDQ